MPLTSVADLPTVVVNVMGSGDRAIDLQALMSCEVGHAAVLLCTGWDRHRGTPEYGRNAPYLSRSGARWLADAGARLVGINTVNIDDTTDPDRPAHSILLKAGVLVLELADALGVTTRPSRDTYDVIVIGAGPSGLAASVCGTSEGSVLLEREAIVGQAGTTSLIRNYLRFPRGLSGH